MKTYSLSTPTTPPDPSEHCLYCWRNYASTDSTITEASSQDFCSPLQIHPCNHYIGKECFHTLVEAGMVDCQYCRRPITIKSDPVPRWLQKITGSLWFRAQEDLMYEKLKHQPTAFNSLEANVSLLFSGTPTHISNIMSCYIGTSCFHACAFALVILAIHCLAYAINVVYQYIIYGPLDGYDILLGIFTGPIAGECSLLNRGIWSVGHFCVAFSAALIATNLKLPKVVDKSLGLLSVLLLGRAVILLFTLRGVLALIVANAVVFHGVVAVIVGLRVWRKDRMTVEGLKGE